MDRISTYADSILHGMRVCSSKGRLPSSYMIRRYYLPQKHTRSSHFYGRMLLLSKIGIWLFNRTYIYINQSHKLGNNVCSSARAITSYPVFKVTYDSHLSEIRLNPLFPSQIASEQVFKNCHPKGQNRNSLTLSPPYEAYKVSTSSLSLPLSSFFFSFPRRPPTRPRASQTS